jgi:hypothetical protein
MVKRAFAWPPCAAAVAVLATAIAAGAGCAGRPPVRAEDPGAFLQDSTGTRQDELIDDGRLDGVVAPDPADGIDGAGAPDSAHGFDGAGTPDPADGHDGAAQSAPPARGSGSGIFEIEAVGGYRSDARVRWAGGPGFIAGARWSGGEVSGFAGFEGRGALRALYAGRITLRSAERLVLGRGLGSYALSGSGPVRNGFAVSPSFSRWYGYPGVAADVSWKGWRAAAVALAPSSSEDELSPAAVWAFLSRDFGKGAAGFLAGAPPEAIGLRRGDAAGAGGAEPSDGGDRPRVAAFFASIRAGPAAASAEAARTGGRTFAALRLASREKGAGPRWSALFFEAPGASPLGPSGLERVVRTDRGARLDVAGAAGRIRLEAWAVSGRTRSEKRQTEYRRLGATVRDGAAALWWSASLFYRRGGEEEYPTNPVETEIDSKDESEIRLRAEVGARGGRSVISSVRADVFPGGGGTERGVVLVLSTEIGSGRFAARIQAAAHSLPPGSSVTLGRPAAGPFEWLAPLYGKGSDVAARASVRVARGARVFAFYRSPSSGAPRAYVGFEARR